MNIRIAGERITLRDWEEKDLDLYWHWLQPEHAWHLTDGPYYAAEKPEEIKAGFDKLKSRVLARDFQQPRTSLVIAVKSTDAILGRVSSYWISAETKWLCIGITLYDQETWGQGLGHEALGLWIDHLFAARPDIVRLDLRTWSGNVGMMRLAEKLGFLLEARFRKARIVRGEYYDSIGYGILRGEWAQKFPGGFIPTCPEKRPPSPIPLP